MKKTLILAAVAAIAAVGCTKTYHQVDPATQGPAIGFGTWTETLTKARATGSTNTAFANEEAFDVYGAKTISGEQSVVFNGDDVTATVTGSTVEWDYSTHRYWDPAASQYVFFAALPANQLAAEGTEGAYAKTGFFTSADITFGDPTAFSNDILVANKTVVSGGASAPYSYTGPVNMVFNHVASCVDLKVKQDAALGDAVVKVTSLKLQNISNKGHFVVTAYDGTTNKPTVSSPWTPADTPTTLGTEGVYTVTLPDGGVTAGGKTTYGNDNQAGSTTGTAGTLFEGYVFMPQTLSADTQKIQMSYTIQVGSETPNEYSKTFDIRDFMQTDAYNNLDTSGSALTNNITAWNAGTHYIYYITIGAKVISFTAEVAEWTTADVNGYHYLLQ